MSTMASSSEQINHHERMFEKQSLSYCLDLISMHDLLQLKGVRATRTSLSCTLESCPSTSLGSAKQVSFSCGGNDGSCRPPFIAAIKCKHCPSSNWNICADCPTSITRLTSPRQISDHIRQYHAEYFEATARIRKKRKKQSPTRTDMPQTRPCRRSVPRNFIDLSTVPVEPVDMATNLDEEFPFEDTPLPPLPIYPVVTNPSSIAESHVEATREFFYHDQTAGNGFKYLAARAQFGSIGILPSSLNTLETKMMMQTAELALSLPKKDRDRLALYTSTVCEVVRNQTLETEKVNAGLQQPRPWTLLPITTPFEMRRQMMHGSIHSMMHTIPRVNVEEVGVHAISLPSECLQNLAGHGFPLDFVSNTNDAGLPPELPVRDIASTAMCKKLFDINDCNQPLQADLNIWIFEWSDDFEPNTSLTKSHRGGVWVKTITIGPPGGRKNQIYYTYPIAMGPKNRSHEEAETVIAADLLRLARPEGVVIYSKVHGGLLRVRAKIFVSLQDQPERRGENHLTGGSSDYHRRFGYSFPWQDYGPQLRPCPGCRLSLLDKFHPWVYSECAHCTNFAYDLKHPLLQIAAPEDRLEDEIEFRHPGLLKLDYAVLNDAVSLAHEMYVDGIWSALDVREWLKILCINIATAQVVLRHAEKCKEYQDVMGDPESSNALKAAVTAEKARNPELYEEWPHPAVWNRGVHLYQHPDIPMHLLCLGVVKLVLMRTDRWLTKKHKAQPFVRKMKGMMESINELNLSWLPILPFKGGKFGGWVSENFLTMSRVMAWFYSSLDEIAADQETWTEPDRQMQDWTGDDCAKWLRQRGLDPDGTAAFRRAQVAAFRSTPLNEQPAVVEQPGGPVETVQQTILALDDMMSLLMVEQIDEAKYYIELERTIRVFLTRFADLEENLVNINALPSWLTCFNCLSLLNLPDIIRLYGPIRNIWEGSWVGEGFLRFAKPAVKHGLRKFWQRSTMTNMQRMKGLQVVMGSMNEDSSPPIEEGNEEEDRNEILEHEPRSFKCYRSLRSVDVQIRNGKKTISCIVVRSCLGVACLNASKEPEFVPLTVGAYNSTKMGLHYFKFKRDLQGTKSGLYDHPIDEVAVLLPRIQLMDFDNPDFVPGIFTVVDRSHRHLNLEGVLHGPINTGL